MSTEKIDFLLERARDSTRSAHDAWGESQLDDKLAGAVRDLINVNLALTEVLTELAAAPKPVGPFEAGKVYALVMTEEFVRDDAVTDAVIEQLDDLNARTGATFVILPPGTQLGIATQEE